SSTGSQWFVFGPQGETRATVNSAGTVLGTLSYDAYGNVVSSSGAIGTLMRYGGQWGYYTGMGGLMLCGLRWYDPQQARWLSRDPIGYVGGPNLYEYCDSNPISGIDPLGLQGIPAGAVVCPKCQGKGYVGGPIVYRYRQWLGWGRHH